MARPAIAGKETDVLQKDGRGLTPYLVSPSTGLDRLPRPRERPNDDRLGQVLAWFHVNHNWAIVCQQEVVRNVFALLTFNTRDQEERLRHNVHHSRVEVSEQEPG